MKTLSPVAVDKTLYVTNCITSGTPESHVWHDAFPEKQHLVKSAFSKYRYV
jgi:hypothetical protein